MWAMGDVFGDAIGSVVFLMLEGRKYVFTDFPVSKGI